MIGPNYVVMNIFIKIFLLLCFAVDTHDLCDDLEIVERNHPLFVPVGSWQPFAIMSSSIQLTAVVVINSISFMVETGCTLMENKKREL